jgi:hypothetical protein
VKAAGPGAIKGKKKEKWDKDLKFCMIFPFSIPTFVQWHPVEDSMCRSVLK